MKIRMNITGAAFLCAMALAACNKKNNADTTTGMNGDKENVQYVAASDQVSTDMEEAFDEGLQRTENGAQTPMNGIVLGPCVTVTLTQNGNMKVLTIDFGTQGCLCNDGKTRKGKLIATATRFNQVNVLRTLTTQQYYVNDYHVEGTITRNITNDISTTSRQADIVENLTVTNPGGQTVYTRNATLTRIFNFNTPGTPTDNTMTTWGQVSLSRPNGTQISRLVSQSTPLLFKNACHQIVSGIAQITINGNAYTIDFGNGACDDIATASNGTSTWTINL